MIINLMIHMSMIIMLMIIMLIMMSMIMLMIMSMPMIIIFFHYFLFFIIHLFYYILLYHYILLCKSRVRNRLLKFWYLIKKIAPICKEKQTQAKTVDIKTPIGNVQAAECKQLQQTPIYKIGGGGAHVARRIRIFLAICSRRPLLRNLRRRP